MKIALVSLNQEWENKEINSIRCQEIVGKAARDGCELVVLPEMTLSGFSPNVNRLSELENDSWTLKFFGGVALREDIDIVFGALIVPEQGKRPRNAFCFAESTGTSCVVYEKIHPFSASGEQNFVEEGSRLGTFHSRGFTIGAAVCYDLRFPEMFSLMSRNTDAFVTIANWPERRIGHWRALHIARAIENQCFSIGVNRIGVDGKGERYCRSSLIVSPDGEVLAPLETEDEVDIYDISIRRVEDVRAAFPTLRDKRKSLYRALDVHV